MGHLVRAVVLLAVALYLSSDIAVVEPGSPGRVWVGVLAVGWAVAFLVYSWRHTVGLFAWAAVIAAVATAMLSWYLAPAVDPSLGEYTSFTWPESVTISAGAIAGRIIVVARTWRDRLPAVLITIAVIAGAFSEPMTLAFILLDTGLILTCAFTIAAVGIAQRHRIAAERQVAVAQERARLADELHDRIAHEITGIVVLAQGSAALAANGPVQRPLELIESSGLRAMEHIRTIVGRSGPHTLDHSPPALGRPDPAPPPIGDVSARLARIIDDYAGTTTATVTRPAPVEVALEAHVWDLVERAVREALTNIRRHASTAARVRVHTVADSRAFTVTITDDGTGGGLGTGGGSGLDRLTRQLRAVGGQLSAAPGSSGGWQVCLSVPVTSADRRSRP